MYCKSEEGEITPEFSSQRMCLLFKGGAQSEIQIQGTR